MSKCTIIKVKNYVNNDNDMIYAYDNIRTLGK